MWLSIINYVYLYSVRPLKSKQENQIEIMNEFSILECAYIYNIFVRGEGSIEFFNWIGWIFIGFSIFNTFYNLSFVFFDTFETCLKKGKQKIKQRKIEKIMKIR